MELTCQTKITVLMGGPGTERPISLASGHAVTEALRSAGYNNVEEVDITSHEVRLPRDTELVFNLIHGTFGEDGELQEQLEKKGIPYTGAGVKASRLCFDKVAAKQVFLDCHVPTPRSETLYADKGEFPTLNLPIVIKPPREGSSMGVHIVHTQNEIDAALADVARYGNEILVEEFIKGRELTVTILDNKALPVIHICPKSGFYDLNNKYPWLAQTGQTDYICPADITEEETRKVQEAALAAHKAAGVEVYSRVDVILADSGEPYVIEINTIPGMTSSSLVPKAASAVGINFPELCAEIARLSLNIPRGIR